jgi:hypothetical protein
MPAYVIVSAEREAENVNHRYLLGTDLSEARDARLERKEETIEERIFQLRGQTWVVVCVCGGGG